MDSYPTFTSVIDALGGSVAFGKIISKPIGTASAMKTRDRIPPAHWDAVVRGAAASSVPGITHELLSRLYAARVAPEPAAPERRRRTA